jgi:hypothetical protein
MNSPAGFQQFQRDFGLHLRDPRRAPRPAGVPARRASAYRELLFNNVCGIVDACFPVASELLGERRWGRLQRAFFAEWRSQSPLFCDLPREFLRWLSSVTGEGKVPVAMPAWMPELLHYEWAELAVDIMQAAPLPKIDASSDLLDGRPVVAPAHMVLAYAWPVHRIGREWKPRKPAATHLVVFRDSGERVQFAEINAVTARLLTLLADGKNTGRDACLEIATELGHPNPEAVIAGGATMLNDLKNWGVIRGVAA